MNTQLVIALLKRWLLEQMDKDNEVGETCDNFTEARDAVVRSGAYQMVLNELAKIEVEVLTGKDMA